MAENVCQLAERFSSAIVPDEFTTAELQGYLLSCKTAPEAAVAGISSWIEQEHKERQERKEREASRKRQLEEKQNAFLKGRGYGYAQGRQPPVQVVIPPTPQLDPTAGIMVAPVGDVNVLVVDGDHELSPSPAYEPLETHHPTTTAE